MKNKGISLLILLMCIINFRASASDVITFADVTVKNLCVTFWDSDKDGELSYAEAGAVTSIGTVFTSNETITSFDELQYFTNVTSINTNAFYYCTSLKSVVLPNSVKSVNRDAFARCFSLERVVLSNSLTTIGIYAFDECESLTQISFPASLKTIEDCAFSNCINLTNIHIPRSVTDIGCACFCGCISLTAISVDEANTSYHSGNGSNVIVNSSTKELITGCQTSVIPLTVKSIGEDSFSDCPGLKSIEIPSSVTSISSWAFCNCTGLTDVVIPNSVTNIDSYAFEGCIALKSVTSHITDVFATGANAFLNCGNAKLYVQGDLIEQYQSISDWKRFKSIEAIPATVMLSCNGKGGVSMNGGDAITATICELVAMDGAPNAFVFTPNEDCLLEEVIVDGENMTNQVSNNALNVVVHDGSKVIVSFRNVGVDMDVNHDGSVNISDVVTLVNFILGN